MRFFVVMIGMIPLTIIGIKETGGCPSSSTPRCSAQRGSKSPGSAILTGTLTAVLIHALYTWGVLSFRSDLHETMWGYIAAFTVGGVCVVLASMREPRKTDEELRGLVYGIAIQDASDRVVYPWYRSPTCWPSCSTSARSPARCSLIFGVIVTIVGLTASDADIQKAAGINLSLIIGLIMLVVGAIFITWLLLRPPELLHTHEVTEDDLPEQLPHHGLEAIPEHQRKPPRAAPPGH